MSETEVVEKPDNQEVEEKVTEQTEKKETEKKETEKKETEKKETEKKETEVEESKKIVKVYSTQYCAWCHKLKDFLKEHSVEFQDVDVGTDQEAAKEMVEKSGQTGVPVTTIGDEVIVGFDKPKLIELLKIKE